MGTRLVSTLPKFRDTVQRADADIRERVTDYEGVGHGFAIRGDPKDEHVRKSADDAFEQSVKFIKAHL